MEIEADDKHIFTAYRKGSPQTKFILGKMTEVPRLMVIKCSVQLKQILLKNMSRLKGKRHPVHGYRHYIDKHEPDVVRDTKNRHKKTIQSTKNQGKHPRDKTYYRISGTNLHIKGKLVKDDIFPPSPSELFHYADGKDPYIKAINFSSSDTIKDAGSSFTGYATRVSSLQDVKLAYIKLAIAELNV